MIEVGADWPGWYMTAKHVDETVDVDASINGVIYI